MIKRLKRKFVLTTSLSLFIVLSVFISTINIINILDVKRRADFMLKIISDNRGVLPNKFDDHKSRRDEEFIIDFDFGDRFSMETPFETRYFSIKVFDDGSLSINVQNIAAIDFYGAKGLGEDILNSNKSKGYTGFYRFLSEDKGSYRQIVFLDCRNDLRRVLDFLFISLLVEGLFIVVFLFIFNFVSKYAIKPFIDNIEKQKRFITDAGHEIKTPLAIISANTEVLEMFNGENEWTKSTMNQIERLNNLVKGLISLSKMDEGNLKFDTKKCFIGKTLKKLSLEFSTMFTSKGLKVDENIDEGISFNCNEDYIYNLFSILLDNAFKYSKENGEVGIFLGYVDSKIEIIISNTCDESLEGNLNYLFDRFYREDNSRSRETGGYGLGLSIAESIVKAHKGSIDAIGKKGNIYFKIKFSK